MDKEKERDDFIENINQIIEIPSMEFIVLAKQSIVFVWGRSNQSLEIFLFSKSFQHQNHHIEQLSLKEVAD